MGLKSYYGRRYSAGRCYSKSSFAKSKDRKGSDLGHGSRYKDTKIQRFGYTVDKIEMGLKSYDSRRY